MFKLAAVALFAGLAGGLAVLVIVDAPTSGDRVIVEPGDANAGAVTALEKRVDTLQREIDLQAIPASPPRVEVTSAPADLEKLAARIDLLEEELAKVRTDMGLAGARRATRIEELSHLLPQPEVTRNDVLQQELQQRKNALAKDDAEGHVQLATWAEAQGLKTDAKRLLRQAIKIDPNHQEARLRLGYKSFDHRWRTAAEIERLNPGKLELKEKP